jgi:hypothetical protein
MTDENLKQDNELFDQNSQASQMRVLSMLKKDLDKEMRVKEGLDRLLLAHATSATKNAYQSVHETGIIADTRAKIASLRMQIDQLQMKMNGDRCKLTIFVLNNQILVACEFDQEDFIVQDLLFRLYKEEAIADGAKNLIRTLADMKKPDLKTAKDASETCEQSEEKVQLIKLALQKYEYDLLLFVSFI